MKELNPYLRFITHTSYVLNRKHTIAYDCRLLYVISGYGRFFYDKVEFKLEAGSLLYYPPGIPYQLESDWGNPMHYFTLNFDFTNGYEHGNALPPVQVGEYDPTLLRPSHHALGDPLFFSPLLRTNAGCLQGYLLRLNELAGHSEERKKKTEQVCSAILLALILEIIHLDTRSVTKNKIVEDTAAYINLHFAEPLTNISIATEMKYHPYYLGTLFQTHLGKTLRQYLEDVRLSTAEQLLAEGKNTVFEVSELCGFKTAEHFSKRFKKKYGITPTEWKKNHSLI